jgi:hypothetical protein
MTPWTGAIIGALARLVPGSVLNMGGDRYEAEVTDEVLRGEIELLADVMAAAGQAEVSFTNAQLDLLLGLAHGETADEGTS